MAVVSRVLRFVGDVKPITMCTLITNLINANSVGEVLHISGMIIEIYSQAFRSAKSFISLIVQMLSSLVISKLAAVFQVGDDAPVHTAPEPTILDDGKEISDAILKTRLVQRVKAILANAWTISRDLVAACSGVLLAFAALCGSLCPGVKPARVMMNKFLDLVKVSKAVQHAKDFNIIDFDSFQQVVNNIFYEASIPAPWSEVHSDVITLRELWRKDQLLMSSDVASCHKVDMVYRTLSAVDHKAVPTNVATILKQDFIDIDHMKQSIARMKQSTGVRVKPVVLVLAGEPGVGKSTFINRVADEVNKDYGTKGVDAWTCGSDHQDSLEGRPVMLMDEFGLTNLKADVEALQRVSDTSPFHPNMDKIENKTMHIAPRLVIVCTNHENIYKACAFPPALARRINHHVLVENPALLKWKTDNAGKRMTDAELAAHFTAHPSIMWELPDCATDWNGGCFTPALSVVKGPVTAIDEHKLIGSIRALLDMREKAWRKENIPTFQSGPMDRGIFCFRGPPGTGKTTLAKLLPDTVKIYNDPHVSETKFAEFLSDVMDDERDHKVLFTINGDAFDRVLIKRGQEAKDAFWRRVVGIWDFGFTRSGFIYGHHTKDDVATKGWARVVRITYDGVEVDNGHPTKIINAWINKEKYSYELPRSNPTVTEVLVRVQCDLASLNEITPSNVLERVTIVSPKITAPIIMRLLYDFANVSRQSRISSPVSACRSLNSRRIMVAVPMGLVVLNDVTFQIVGSEPLAVTLVAPNPQPEPPTFHSLFDHAGVDLDDALVDSLWSIFGTILGVIGIITTPKVVPKQYQSDDAYDSGLRGVVKSRTVKRSVGYGEHVMASVERDADWDALPDVDYSEKIIFESNVSKYIYPACNSAGDKIAWVVVTSGGILMNRHVVPACRKIGSHPLGECEVKGVRKTDIAFVRPPSYAGLSRMNCGFGFPVRGETISRVDADGSETEYVIMDRRVIPAEDGRSIVIWLASGPRTKKGDCGLPYVRRVGSLTELVGVHAGALGDQIMITPIMLPPDFEVGSGEGKTFLYKTQFAPLNDEIWLPACKKSTDDNLDRDDIIVANAQPFFATIKDRLLNMEIENSVLASIEYIRQLVPTWTKWGWKAALKSLDMTTSAGPSYKVKKSEVFDSDFDPTEKYQATFFRDCKTLTANCEIVIKDEMRKISKIETCSSRLIFSFDVGQVVQAKQYVGSIQKQLIDSVGEHFSAVGISYMAGTWSSVASKLKQYEHHIDADFAAWDKSMSSTMLTSVVRVYTSPIDDLDERTKARKLLDYMSHANTQFGTTRQGLPSGMPCTSHLNSIAHLIMVNHAMASHGYGPYGSDDRVWFTSYGDDFVCGVRDPSFLDTLRSVWSDFGFTATNASKTGPPSLVGFHDLRFLKRGFTTNKQGTWMAPLDISSIEKSLRFTRAPTPYLCDGTMRDHLLLGDAQYSRLQMAFTEAYQHGEEYYNDLKKRVIKCAADKKFRLFFIIPTFKQFRIRIDPICSAQNQLCVNSVNNPVVIEFQMETPTNAMTARAETVNGQEDLIAGVTPASGDVAGPTVGLEHGYGTTGGVSVIDPAIKERWAPAPGGAFTVSNLTTPGTIIWQARVTPDLNTFTTYLKELYNAWGGGFELQIFLGANNFIGGKLGLFFIPPGIDPSKLATDDLLAFPKSIIDIRTCDMMSFRASDVKKVTWHQVGDESVDGYGGTIVLVVITNVISSGSDNITIDGRVMSRPAPEFDFAFLKSGHVDTSGSNFFGSYYNLVADAMSDDPFSAVNGAPAPDVLILPRSTEPVNKKNNKTIIKLDGTDYVSGTTLVGPKHRDLIAYWGSKHGGTDYTVSFNLDDGSVWDHYKTGGFSGSKSLPPQWVGISPGVEAYIHFVKANTRLVKLWKVTYDATKFVITPEGTDLPTFNQRIVISIHAVPNRSDPNESPLTWTPPNGESVVAFANLDVADSFAALQTVQQQQVFAKYSHDTKNAAILMNLTDGGKLTGVQVKVYPNGVTTAAGVTSSVLFAGSPVFSPVGLVAQDYKLAGISGNSHLKDTSVQQLTEVISWLLPSLELSEEASSAVSAHLAQLASMRQTGSKSKDRTRLSRPSCSTGAPPRSVSKESQSRLRTFPGAVSDQDH
ncbi:polyprotien [Fathead minnow calicivirus]|uniref:Polyprotien n=1 Tax=Fathead minnow calicivirus TaxID=1949201 RepID=A0A240F7S2_9CALI|nr:polyprotien [Fathead minnow calicivirus]AQM56929.1 polyprotien [Fathead minnow calicivirus]